MTLSIHDFDGAVALDDVQQLQGPLGTGVTSGCTPSLPSNTSPITIAVASGDVYVSGTQVTFAGGSIELPDGDAQHPRKDVVYVDSGGALQALHGDPRAPKDGTPDPGTDRHVYQPEPPDLSSLSSVADAAVVAEIWVPAGATSTADMTDSGVQYVRDRRLRPWADAVKTDDDPVSEHAPTHKDGGGDELDVADLSGGFGSSGQVPRTDGSAVSWATLGHGDLANITSNDHHTRYTDEEARDAAGGMATDGLVHDDANDDLGLNVVASGSVTLSSGAATIDTGVATSTTATFQVALGPATDDADVAADIRADSGSGTYAVDIEETDTAVGNPSVEYDIIRVR